MIASTALSVVAIPATSAASPGGQGIGKRVAGERTFGDPLLPQVGNGGYDIDEGRIYLDYDPATNAFNAARTTVVQIVTFLLAFFGFSITVIRAVWSGPTMTPRTRVAFPDR